MTAARWVTTITIVIDRRRPAETVQPPVHLDGRVYQYLCEKAQRKGVSLEGLVNDLLKETIELSWRLES